jgi:hypothetical protein
MASMDKKLVNGYAITTLSIKKHFILTFYPVNLDIERKKQIIPEKFAPTGS